MLYYYKVNQMLELGNEIERLHSEAHKYKTLVLQAKRAATPFILGCLSNTERVVAISRVKKYTDHFQRLIKAKRNLQKAITQRRREERASRQVWDV
jgi:hypothetical protein